MSRGYQGMMNVRRPGGWLLAATALVVANGCDVSKEPPPGGDPKVVSVAAASSPTPSTEPPVTVVSHEVAPATLSNRAVETPLNVSYGDAETVFRKGRYAEAAVLFDAYTRRKPENVWGHYMLGIAAWRAGDHARAEEALMRTLEIDRKHGKALVNLSRVLLEQNRAAAAHDYAEEAVEVSPQSGDAWRVLGNVRSALGSVEPAAKAYRRALVIDEQDAWSMNNLGLLMIRSGRYEEALPALARATELKPRLAVFQNNLGIALERNGHLVEAADAFRVALEVDPKYTRAQESLVRVEARIVDDAWRPLDLKNLAGTFADEIVYWREQLERTGSITHEEGC
jgi:Tfp pilus assembly protein PilF